MQDLRRGRDLQNPCKGASRKGVHGRSGRGPGGVGVSGGGPGGQKKAAQSTKKPEKRSGTVWLGGSSRPNGSGYPLSVPAVPHPPSPI